MAMTAAVAQTHLDDWLAADIAASKGQAYSVNMGNGAGRTVTRADADIITKKISYWQRVVNDLNAAAAGNTNAGFKKAKWV